VLVESDEHGDMIERIVSFDPDEVDAAYAELDERYAAGEAAPFARTLELRRAFGRALASRDWDAMATLHAPDLVVNDHRPLGWETLHGLAHVESLKSLVDLAPDVQPRNHHVTVSDRAALEVFTWLGTREGGAFEITKVGVIEIDGTGRHRRYDVYDLDQLDEAWKRFEAIGASTARDPIAARPDPLRILPNAATRSWDRWDAANAAGDFGAVRALYNPDHRLDDRRRLMRMTVGLDGTLSTERFMIEGGWRGRRTVLATAGDRLVLVRVVWTTGESGADSEIEMLEVDEVDRDGRFIVAVTFDPDDRRAASAELLDRYARSDEVRWPPAMLEAFRAINDHDLDRFRATLADDFVFYDRRRTGVGRIVGADDYVASIRPLFEEAPDFFTDNLYVVAEEAHGSLSVSRTFGTLATGGEFESVFVRLVLYRDDRMVAVEQFELEDLDVARARFEELRTATAA